MGRTKPTTKLTGISWLVIGIIGFVVILLGTMLYVQNSYSHKLQQLTLKLSNGPVSSEFQKNIEVVVTKDYCNITISEQKGTETKGCLMNPEIFGKIQNSVNEYSVIEKIMASGTVEEPGLIGGKEASITIKLNNGDSYSTELTTVFINKLEPFFEELELLVPSIQQTIPSQ